LSSPTGPAARLAAVKATTSAIASIAAAGMITRGLGGGVKVDVIGLSTFAATIWVQATLIARKSGG
jgi:hypothetical protein